MLALLIGLLTSCDDAGVSEEAPPAAPVGSTALTYSISSHRDDNLRPSSRAPRSMGAMGSSLACTCSVGTSHGEANTAGHGAIG